MREVVREVREIVRKVREIVREVRLQPSRARGRSRWRKVTFTC